jgi:hypothetical protein
VLFLLALVVAPATSNLIFIRNILGTEVTSDVPRTNRASHSDVAQRHTITLGSSCDEPPDVGSIGRFFSYAFR